MHKFCDLHTHSNFSDGSFTPEQLIRMAEEAGLDSLALCDHNTVSGLPHFMRAARNSTVKAIAGVEFSTDHNGTELHILGLFIPEAAWPNVHSFLEEGIKLKEQNNLELISALQKKSIYLDYDEIRNATPDGQVNRALIAQAMMRKGYVSSVKEAFDHWLSPQMGLYRPPYRPDACETIGCIHSFGGAAVLAHPFSSMNETRLRIFLKQAAEYGLDGMETLYSTYDTATEQLAVHIAREYGLLQSGGSDFHGAAKPDISLGTGRGNLRVPAALACILEQRAATYAKIS